MSGPRPWQPAKCPACDGWGERLKPQSQAPPVRCPACKGAGVLWPPKEGQ